VSRLSKEYPKGASDRGIEYVWSRVRSFAQIGKLASGRDGIGVGGGQGGGEQVHALFGTLVVERREDDDVRLPELSGAGCSVHAKGNYVYAGDLGEHRVSSNGAAAVDWCYCSAVAPAGSDSSQGLRLSGWDNCMNTQPVLSIRVAGTQRVWNLLPRQYHGSKPSWAGSLQDFEL
jgi:hypothetical protein